MSSRFMVKCCYAPLIRKKSNFAFPHCYHRFYGYTHPVFESYAISPSAEIRNRRSLMHFFPYAMTSQFSYNSVAFCLTIVLNCIAYVSDFLSCSSDFYCLIQGVFCGSKKSFDIFINLSYTKCVSGIATKAIKKRSTINGNNITFLKYLLLRRDSMDNTVIYRCAYRCREGAP